MGQKNKLSITTRSFAVKDLKAIIGPHSLVSLLKTLQNEGLVSDYKINSGFVAITTPVSAEIGLMFKNIKLGVDTEETDENSNDYNSLPDGEPQGDD